MGEQRQQSVVGVLTDPPLAGRLVVGQRRIVEDPEQHGRVAREVLFEPVIGQPEPDGDAAHQCVCNGTQRVEPVEDRRSELARRKEIRSVQWRSGEYAWVIRRMLESDVQTLLAVGNPGRQLAADREPAPPSGPGVRHRVRRLVGVVELEEATGEGVHPGEQRRVDAVSGHTEEAQLAARGVDLARHAGHVVTPEQRADVDQRQPVRSVGAGVHGW